jgi:hypothetical protein
MPNPTGSSPPDSRGEEEDVSLALQALALSGGRNIRTSGPGPLRPESLPSSSSSSWPFPRVCRLLPAEARGSDGFGGRPFPTTNAIRARAHGSSSLHPAQNLPTVSQMLPES